MLGLQGPHRKELTPKPPTVEAESPKRKSTREPKVTYDMELIEKNDEPVLAEIPGRWELPFNERKNQYWKKPE